ncbi:MAG: tetratricopeptide repeat protein [Candidatus Dadabacteria bacterium]|nr:tetratricopeptide repeat protein [Candidatus Dadabacteria bacterium]NIQ14401.1 tetratricopeptide repeat protein [Candidatus Dadabacteria bacterium]
MNLKLLTPLCITTLFLASCVATQDDVGGIYSRQSRLEAKVERITKELNVLKSKNIGTISSDDLNEQVFQLENKVFELEQIVSDVNDKINRLSEEQSRINTQTTQPTSTTVSEIPETTDLNISDYEKGHSELAAGEYESARKYLRSYISKNKKGDKVPGAIFYIADSYYRERLYEDAILEYQTLIDRYPKDRNVPLAYLKQGYSLIEIEKIEEAKLFFESLIDKFPSSREAEEARKKLKELEAT